MTGRLAQAAGATVTIIRKGNGVHSLRGPPATRGSPLRGGGLPWRALVRYSSPARCPVMPPARLELRPGHTGAADPLYPVQEAHADASSPCAGPTISSSNGQATPTR